MEALNITNETLLECPICFETLKPPIETCMNGHGVCKTCRKKSDFCGLCRSGFSGIKNTLLNQVIGSVITKCKYNPQGCDKSYSIATLEDHEKFCYFRKDKCHICREGIYLPNLNDHFRAMHRLLLDEMNFSIPVVIQIKLSHKRWGKSFFVRDNRTCFLLLTHYTEETGIISLTLQYVGKNQQDFNKYKYDLEIDQGLSKPNQSIFKCSGLCVPYIFDYKEKKTQERKMDLHLKSIFLKNIPLTEFTVFMTIKPLL